MEFLRKHFEKLLLSLVLLVLAAAVGYLPIKIKQNQEEIRRADENPSIATTSRTVKSEDLSKYDATLKKNPPGLALDGPHNLFNPVPWRKTSDGRLHPIKQTGLEALVVTQISPLHLILAFDNVTGKAEAMRFAIGVTRETDPSKSKRRKIPAYVSLGAPSKSDPFLVKSVIGPPDNPTGLVLELMDTKERVTVTKDKPFMRVEGYKADLKYDPENKIFPNRRAQSESSDTAEYQIELDNDKYNIVAISEKDVTVAAVSTSKRSVIKLKP
jgi:hypothetical protein